jgi:secreted trypsin-like serine protease
MNRLSQSKFLVFSFLLSFSLQSEAIQPRIIGGTNAAGHAYPFVVSLEYKTDSDQFCSGSLISPTKVLTAAHCVKENKTVQVRLGTNNKNKLAGQVIEVAEQLPHPKFDDTTLDYDVAVFTLASPAKLSDNVNVIAIPQPCSSLSCVTGLAKPNTLVRVAGWGAMSPNGAKKSKSLDLNEVDVPIVSNAVCKKAMQYDGDITNRMICAGFSEGGKDSCIGDSGGPLFSYMANARAGLQTGIVSWGDNWCGRANSYGVYTRISDVEINSFIKSNI